MQHIDLLKLFLKSISTEKSIKNKYCKKKLIITEEEEQLFQQSSSCWICEKLIDNDNKSL